MDAGMAIKPLVAMPGAPSQPKPQLVSAPILNPPERVVPAPAKIDSLRQEQRRQQAAMEKTTRDAIIDPETQAVVYRVRDARTGQVLHQQPERSVLRAQAYARAQLARALAEGENPLAVANAAQHKIDCLT